jgi:hypothetical protein
MFHFGDCFFLHFSLPASRKTKGQIIDIVPQNTTNAIKLQRSASLNLSVRDNPVLWGSDVPLWESTISKSMVNGGQPLVRETSQF